MAQQPASADSAGRWPPPLSGVRVLDLGMWWAGPLLGRYLATLGAQVIKIESVQHPDYYRFVEVGASPDRNPDRLWERTRAFMWLNTGKLDLTLDLSRPEGQEIFKRLVAISDVVAENFSPRVMENFGLAYETLREINPRIIMLRMPGYGLSGPYRDYVSFGPTIESMTGLPQLTGYPDAPQFFNTIADPFSGTMALFAVLLALEHRQRTGQGQQVELAQLEAAMLLSGEAFMDYSLNQRLWERTANRHTSMAPHNCYPCQGDDRWVVITIGSDEEWKRFCQVAQQPQWLEDPRFQTVESRWQHQDALDEMIADWTRQHDRFDIMRRLQAAGVPAAAVYNPGELARDQYLRNEEPYETVEHPVSGPWAYPIFPAHFYGTELTIGGAAPTLGQHNRYVLHDLLGMSDEEISRLQEQAIIGDRPLYFTR